MLKSGTTQARFVEIWKCGRRADGLELGAAKLESSSHALKTHERSKKQIPEA